MTTSKINSQKQLLSRSHYLLFITRNFPPLVGGMERLNANLVTQLQYSYPVGLVGPKGSSMFEAAPPLVWECPPSPASKFILCALFNSFRAVFKLRPSILFAGSGLTAPIAWVAARLTGTPLIAYLHGLDIEAKHPVFQTIWPAFYRLCDCVLVNSRFTKRLAEKIGVSCERIRILHPGVELPNMDEASKRRYAFRNNYSIGDAPMMLYVGRCVRRKGLANFTKEIFPLILRKVPSAKLVIIGENASSALKQENDELGEVKKNLALHGIEHCVLFLGKVEDNELTSAYFAADTLIFPVLQQPHDNEGFGMVAIEAAAHGLPTVAFAAGGVPDAVANGISGKLVSAGDNAKFAESVISILQQPNNNKLKFSCRKFAEEFSWTCFGQRVREICYEFQTPSKR